MATVNLGSIKFKWKGTYNGGSSYTIDDVVEYNGSSYICKLASTGNLPTNTTYFDVMSQAGTNGTNGTDVGTVITTQGDLLYRDGSGLQRLGAGTAGQVLTTNGAGANPSWGSAGGLVETGFEIKTGSQTINSTSPTAISYATFTKSLTAGQKILIQATTLGYLDDNDRTVQREIYVTPPSASAIPIATTATGSGGMGSASVLYSWYWYSPTDMGWPQNPTWVYEAQSTGSHSFQLYHWTTSAGNSHINQVYFNYLITNV